MTEFAFRRNRRWTTGHSIYLITLLVVTSLLAAAALLLPLSTRQTTIRLSVGDVAGQDILAPRAITYESEVLTERVRGEAAENVEAVYSPPDSSVARRQIQRLRAALDFISNVRADNLASQEQKLADLAALQDVHLGEESANEILALGDNAWQAVQQEAITVLEQVMRSSIRDDQLEDARRGVPALVSLSLSEEQAAVVAALVSAFVAPNQFYNESLTAAAREAARQEVEPITRVFLADETVVPRGKVITEEDLEALEALGLVEPQLRWQEQVSVIALVASMFTFMVLYMLHRPNLLADLRGLTLVAILFLIFLYGARITIPGRTVFPYLYPVAGFSMVVAAVFSSQVGRLFALPLGILAAYGMPNSLELTLYFVLSGMIGVLILRKAERITRFFWAGAGVSVVGSALILAYRLPEPTTDLIGLATLIGAAIFNGTAAASLTLILQFFLAQVLGLTTALQLLDMARADQELLQFILRKAPGTYQHSLQVANLAEQAAELIGADALLTRVGALYHDAGKARHPHYFIENQVPGSPNPHEELTPSESAKVIIQHVPDGLELAAKFRLPSRIQEFIAEHHGDLLTNYQYVRAVEAAGGDRSQVEEEEFRYPGPRPQSRETALVMLADGIEARSRAERPQDEGEILEIVEDVINNRLSAKQLGNTTLTMQDLNVAAESFVATLRGIYHPRIHYPKLGEETKPSPSEETTSAA